MKSKSICNELATYFAKIPDSIVTFETRKPLLIDASKLYQSVFSDINEGPGEKGGLCNKM